MRTIRVTDINQKIEQLGEKAFLAHCERQYEDNIRTAARKILRTANRQPIVLLSGPSGSGKTTSAMRIKEMLDGLGHKAHAVSLDNYYHRNEGKSVPLDEEGNIDYESPLLLDLELLHLHLRQMARGDTVRLPAFDFIAQRRIDSGESLTRRRGEVVIFEGIHALNPMVTGGAEYVTRLEVSVQTQVALSQKTYLEPEKIRLCRRLLRDRRTRGQSFSDTISRLRSVSRGEQLYIEPFRDLAEISIDTFMPCELSIYKSNVFGELSELSEEFCTHNRLDELITVLTQLEPMHEHWIPTNSLIREFIGGGILA